ncbi:cytochrome P450 [Neofusicoccum parvum]|nr:cytochrome P450 [Neofusicoccum parvum]
MEKWARQHGEIFRVRSGIVTEYFINSDKAVKAIFDKSSAASSERPRWIIANELFTNQWNVLFLNASDPRWKNQRRVMNTHLSSPARADAGLPFLNWETLKFLHEVAHDPNAGTDKQELWPKIGRYTYSAFAQQTFGLEIKDTSSPSIPYIHETGLAEIIATFPGVYLVDMIQTLDKLPSFMKKVKKLIHNGIVPEALLPHALMDPKLLGLSCEDEAAFLCLQLIIGAADTASFLTF